MEHLQIFNKILKWGGQGRGITRSRDRDDAGQHGEAPSLLKIF